MGGETLVGGTTVFALLPLFIATTDRIASRYAISIENTFIAASVVGVPSLIVTYLGFYVLRAFVHETTQATTTLWFALAFLYIGLLFHLTYESYKPLHLVRGRAKMDDFVEALSGR